METEHRDRGIRDAQPNTLTDRDPGRKTRRQPSEQPTDRLQGDPLQARKTKDLLCVLCPQSPARQVGPSHEEPEEQTIGEDDIQPA
jgi:hypothetical protein